MPTTTAVRMRRFPTRRAGRLAALVAAVLLALGAFLLWGPVGLGNGPLRVETAGPAGWVDQHATPVGFIVPIYNSGHDTAVVDAVAFIGGSRFRGPRLLRLAVVSDAHCLGAWPARADGAGFQMEQCGGRSRGPLIGRGIAHVGGTSPGYPAAAEAAQPPPGSCWVLTKVVVHYHVGIRHYTASDPFELAVCTSDAQVSAAMDAAENAPAS